MGIFHFVESIQGFLASVSFYSQYSKKRFEQYVRAFETPRRSRNVCKRLKRAVINYWGLDSAIIQKETALYCIIPPSWWLLLSLLRSFWCFHGNRLYSKAYSHVSHFHHYLLLCLLLWRNHNCEHLWNANALALTVWAKKNPKKQTETWNVSLVYFSIAYTGFWKQYCISNSHTVRCEQEFNTGSTNTLIIFWRMNYSHQNIIHISCTPL